MNHFSYEKMITSKSNPKVKHIRRLQAERRYRNREQAYVVEGTRWLTELLVSEISPQIVLATQSWSNISDNQALVKALQVPAIIASDEVIAHASDTVMPAGVLAVVPIQSQPLPHKPSFLLILDKVTNPGNLGTILRTSAAAGADGVILAPGCVDAYNPKVIRGSMGAHLRIPFLTLSWSEITALTARMVVWIASASGDMLYSAVEWKSPSAIIVGSEAIGAGKEAKEMAVGTITIPMHRATESLNAAVAAAIILFEIARQRRA